MGQGRGSRRRMPAATPIPAPATLAATRTASPTGSGPRAGCCAGCGPGLARSRAGRAEPVREDAALALGACDRAAVPFGRPPEPFAWPALFGRACAALPLARLSLRRPGRERGRFPITPGSSVTVQEYERGLTIPRAPCLEIRCFARERP